MSQIYYPKDNPSDGMPAIKCLKKKTCMEMAKSANERNKMNVISDFVISSEPIIERIKMKKKKKKKHGTY